MGCEISFLIFVGEEQSNIYGLEDIEAEDIAVLLKQQLYDVDAPLHKGKITSTVVDIQYKRNRFIKQPLPMVIVNRQPRSRRRRRRRQQLTTTTTTTACRWFLM